MKYEFVSKYNNAFIMLLSTGDISLDIKVNSRIKLFLNKPLLRTMSHINLLIFGINPKTLDLNRGDTVILGEGSFCYGLQNIFKVVQKKLDFYYRHDINEELDLIANG